MAKKNQNKKEKTSFSKALLIQESILIWIITITFLVLAFICIFMGFFGELPWLSVIVAFPWSAYGVSQMYYYKKSMKENTKDGIVFEQALKEEQVDDIIEQEDIVG
jgi:EamA domain-containing membrane protein RarD